MKVGVQREIIRVYSHEAAENSARAGHEQGFGESEFIRTIGFATKILVDHSTFNKWTISKVKYFEKKYVLAVTLKALPCLG